MTEACGVQRKRIVRTTGHGQFNVLCTIESEVYARAGVNCGQGFTQLPARLGSAQRGKPVSALWSLLCSGLETNTHSHRHIHRWVAVDSGALRVSQGKRTARLMSLAMPTVLRVVTAWASKQTIPSAAGGGLCLCAHRLDLECAALF